MNVKLLLFITSLLCTSCTMAPLTKADTEKIFMHHLNVSQTTAKQRAIQFIVESFNSAKSVIQTNDGNLITGNGIVHLRTGFFGNINMGVTFLIKIESDRYKLKTIFKYVNNVVGDRMPTETWPHFKDDIDKKLKQIDLALLSYIDNKNSDF